MADIYQINREETVTLQEAIDSGRPFTSVEYHEVIQHFNSGTGPFSNLIKRDYFVVDGELYISLELDYEELIAEYKLL